MEDMRIKEIYLVETELRRVSISMKVPRYIYGVEEAGPFFTTLIGNNSLENFYAVYMSAANEVVAISFLAKGDDTGVTISVSEVIRIALLSNAKYILLAHNHPSGIAKPSESDQRITKGIAQAAKLFGIKLIDSIVVCPNNEICSMRTMVTLDDKETHKDEG